MNKTLTAALAAVAAAVPVARADAAPAPRPADYAPGQMIVKFKPGAAAATSLRAHGARIERRLPVHGTVVVGLPEGQDVLQTVADMKRDPRVEYAEPDYYMHALATPNDALFGRQWGLHNSGQTVHDADGNSGADISRRT